MIKTCKYCGRQKRSCDECGEPVIARTVTEKLPNRPYTAVCTFLLCTNLDCKEYGHFNHESGMFMEMDVCDSEECKKQSRHYDPEVHRNLTLSED